MPILAALALHRDTGGIADLDPHRARTDRYVPSTFFETIPSAPRRQAWAKTIGAVLRNVFIEQNASLGTAQQSRQRGLAVQERAIAQTLAIGLDQVESIEDRSMGSPRRRRSSNRTSRRAP